LLSFETNRKFIFGCEVDWILQTNVCYVANLLAEHETRKMPKL